MVESLASRVGSISRQGLEDLIYANRSGALITPELNNSISAYEAQLRDLGVNYQAGMEVYRQTHMSPGKPVRMPGLEIADGIATVWIIEPKLPYWQVRRGSLQECTYYEYCRERTEDIDKLIEITLEEKRRSNRPEFDKLYKDMERVRCLLQAQLLGYADCALEQGDLQSAILSFAAITLPTDQEIKASLLDSQAVLNRITDSPVF